MGHVSLHMKGMSHYSVAIIDTCNGGGGGGGGGGGESATAAILPIGSHSNIVTNPHCVVVQCRTYSSQIHRC